MHEWKPGEKTQITDMASPYYGKIGVVEEVGPKGGLYIKHNDGNIVYHPWGYDIVRGEEITSELEKALRRILNLAKNHQGHLVEAATKDDGLKMIEREANELLKRLT